MAAKHVAFRMEEPSGVRRHRWPVTRGVPFPQGALLSCDNLRLLDGAGREVTLQTKALSAWPDGSVRWALLIFQVDLGRGGGVDRSGQRPGHLPGGQGLAADGRAELPGGGTAHEHRQECAGVCHV